MHCCSFGFLQISSVNLALITLTIFGTMQLISLCRISGEVSLTFVHAHNVSLAYTLKFRELKESGSQRPRKVDLIFLKESGL